MWFCSLQNYADVLATTTAGITRSTKWPVYGLENWGAWVQSPARARDIFPKLPDRLWAPSSLLFDWYRGPFVWWKNQVRLNSVYLTAAIRPNYHQSNSVYLTAAIRPNYHQSNSVYLTAAIRPNYHQSNSVYLTAAIRPNYHQSNSVYLTAAIRPNYHQSNSVYLTAAIQPNYHQSNSVYLTAAIRPNYHQSNSVYLTAAIRPNYHQFVIEFVGNSQNNSILKRRVQTADFIKCLCLGFKIPMYNSPSVYMQLTPFPKDCFQSPWTAPRTVPDNTRKHKPEKKCKLTNFFE